jgi:hypothetical protein
LAAWGIYKIDPVEIYQIPRAKVSPAVAKGFENFWSMLEKS